MNAPAPDPLPLWRQPSTLAWLGMLLLTGVSAAAAAGAHLGGWRLWMGLAVATLAWLKAQLLLHHYLEVARAGPVFRRIVQLFAAVAPLALAASALRESLWL